jgi:hypothetical protein
MLRNSKGFDRAAAPRLHTFLTILPTCIASSVKSRVSFVIVGISIFSCYSFILPEIWFFSVWLSSINNLFVFALLGKYMMTMTDI